MESVSNAQEGHAKLGWPVAGAGVESVALLPDHPLPSISLCLRVFLPGHGTSLTELDSLEILSHDTWEGHLRKLGRTGFRYLQTTPPGTEGLRKLKGFSGRSIPEPSPMPSWFCWVLFEIKGAPFPNGPFVQAPSPTQSWGDLTAPPPHARMCRT